MRRSLLALGATLAVLLPAPARAAGNTFHFSASGPGAAAFWSTFLFEGEPVPNTVYTDTFLFTADQATRSDGVRFDDKFLFFGQFSFKFDRRGNFVFLGETFGFAGGDAVSLSVDRKLSSASVAATVDLVTCTETRRDFVCEDAGTGSVNGSWAGRGDLIRVNDNFHAGSKGFTYNAHFRGQFREASATGDLNGSDFGTSVFADIFNVSFAEVFVCHGC